MEKEMEHAGVALGRTGSLISHPPPPPPADEPDLRRFLRRRDAVLPCPE